MAASPAPAGSPPVSFSSFLTSLAASAMEHLGLLEGTSEVSLARARQVMDLIGVLKAKTAGNLDNDEQRLLDTLMGDLQTRYEQVSKSD